MQLIPWKHLIHHDLNSFEQWHSQTKPRESLLFWAFKKNQLAESVYFNWAQNYYGMSLIKSDFFTENLNPTIWQKYKSAYNWSPEVLPVAEWDGHLFVACLEPVHDLPEQLNAITLFTNLNNLEKCWSLYSSQSIQTTSAKIPSSIPSDLSSKNTSVNMAESNSKNIHVSSASANVKPGASSEDDFFANLQNQEAGIGSEVSRGEETIAGDMPEGFDKELSASGNIQEKEVDFNGFDSIDAKGVESEASTFGAIEEEKGKGPDEALSDVSFEALNQLKAQVIESQKEELGIALLDDESIETTDDSPTANTQIKDSESADKGVEAQPNKIQAAVQSPNPNSQTVEAGLENNVKNFPQNAPKLPVSGKAFTEELQKVKSQYFKAMILKVSGNSVIPIEWDSSFTPRSNEAVEPISLNQPSIFRIVKKSAKPFHGYVSVNDINEKFFDLWNKSQIPDFVTIVPVLKDEEVIGMLCAFADKNINKKASLKLMEQISYNLSLHFLKSA